MNWCIWALAVVFVVCVAGVLTMIRRAPSDKEIWGPDGEPGPHGWDRYNKGEWGKR